MKEKLLTLEIPLNEELYREQLKKFFNFRWKKFKKTIKINIISVIFMLLLALLSYFGKGDTAILYIVLTTIIATILYIQTAKFLKSKKIFHKKIEEIIKENRETNNVGIVELYDDSFYFKNNFIEIKSIWEKTNYEFIDDLFIVNFENTLQSFLFEEKEIGKENFDKLVLIVKKYSKEKKEI